MYVYIYAYVLSCMSSVCLLMALLLVFGPPPRIKSSSLPKAARARGEEPEKEILHLGPKFGSGTSGDPKAPSQQAPRVLKMRC